MTASRTPPTSSRPPLWRDARIIRIVGQAAALLVLFLLLRWLGSNLATNLARQNLGTDFGFLNRPTQFAIPYFPDFDSRSPVWNMVLVGVKNTFLAGFVGIILATVVGLIVGISRLSPNWLLARLATGFVETFRNIPPLVVIIFFGAAIFTFGPLPILREGIEVRLPGTENNLLILSNDQWGIPSLVGGDAVWPYLGLLAGGLVLAVGLWIWRTRVNVRTGDPHHRVLWSFGAFVVVAAIGYLLLGEPFQISWPTLTETRRRFETGFAMNFGFMALTFALGLYTASHIAEIFRGSILAVPSGQTEAASALALSGFQRYRFVVLPQALRIALPPTINQYLNLVKNTSLGVAVAYAEITALTQTSIGNGRPAVQSIVILMAVYLMFSLVISLILNQVNRRFQLVVR
ncbi:MAG: amino acid ABC transporter permease [Actinomycetota bacterium]